MPRVVKKPDVRRQELIEIAMKQFMERGYEKTSVRSIVKAVGGEVGMFYHHFSSKEEIFEAALQQYNSNYVSAVKAIIEAEKESGFLDLLDKLLQHLFNAISEYARVRPQKVNLPLLTMLHQSTMRLLHPVFFQVITVYIERGEIKPPDVEVCLLVDFLLHGMGAVIHSQDVSDTEHKSKCVKKLFIRQLGIEETRI